MTEFFKVGSLLSAYERLFSGQTKKKEDVLLVLLKHTGVRIPPEDVLIKDGVLTLRSSSVVKNEVFMKKSRILDDLRGVGVTKIL